MPITIDLQKDPYYEKGVQEGIKEGIKEGVVITMKKI